MSWISVKDQLPPIGTCVFVLLPLQTTDPVLVYVTAYQKGELRYEMVDGPGGGCWRCEYSLERDDVTHWMAIPNYDNEINKFSKASTLYKRSLGIPHGARLTNLLLDKYKVESLLSLTDDQLQELENKFDEYEKIKSK